MLKHYEMATGRVVLQGLRPKVGRFFHLGLQFLERGVPGMTYQLFSRAARALRTRTQRTLARAILLFEYHLERTLHLVRQKSQARPQEGAASQFLQEVAAHKQELLRRAPSKRVIFDD